MRPARCVPLNPGAKFHWQFSGGAGKLYAITFGRGPSVKRKDRYKQMPSQLQRKPVNTYHHGDLREAMVRAALAEAERGGPEAISIKALAKKLGVSQPAPYRHFADREALLQAVTAEAFRQFNADHARGDRQAVETLETVALCAGRARFRPAAEWNLPADVRLAHHGLRGGRQRAPHRRA